MWRGQVCGVLPREYAEAGRLRARPRSPAAAKRRKATLIIAKLDRLARNVAFISNLMESDVEFVAVDMPQANKFTIHILAAVASVRPRPSAGVPERRSKLPRLAVRNSEAAASHDNGTQKSAPLGARPPPRLCVGSERSASRLSGL